MINAFEQCLDAAEVFTRDVPNKSLFERDVHREKDGTEWAIIAAGIPDDLAGRYFKQGSERAEHAKIPLRLGDGLEATILMLMRPFDWPSEPPKPTKFVAHFAPGDSIPFVEILKGQINVDVPGDALAWMPTEGKLANLA
jgi:hypothetical protein